MMKYRILALALLATALSFSQEADPENMPTDANVVIIVENLPKFEGGTEALMEFLSTNIHFGEEDMGGLDSATVQVGFTIDRNGAVTDVKVVEGVNEALDKEALRLVKSMPYWIPATSDGKRVSAKMLLPLNFSL